MSYAKNLVSLATMSFAISFCILGILNGKEPTNAEINLGTIFTSGTPETEQDDIARIFEAYVKKTNDEGGISGRRIRIFSYDDGGDSRRTLDLVRKLVEVDHVSFLFNIGNRATDVIGPYIRFKKVPLLFSQEVETPPLIQAEILGSYISRNLPRATISILVQADYIGAQFLAGFYPGLGIEHARSAITNMDYIRLADQSVNRVARVSYSNSDILAIFGDADSQLELLREMTKLKWRPLLVMNDAALTLKLDQVDASAGIVSLSSPLRLLTVPESAEWKTFSATYLSGIDSNAGASIHGYILARAMVSLLRGVGDEITSRRLIDGYDRMLREIDLVRFNGRTWDNIESDVHHF